MNRQRLLSALVCLALCLILLPAAARAASYGTVYVGDETLTNTADTPVVYARTDSDGNVTTEDATADAYNVMWDGSVLTLHNATIGEAQEYSGKSNESIAVYRAAGDLTITLVGENTIDAPGNGTAASCGINVNAGSLTIGGGDGASLKVFGGDTINGNSCGIYAFGTITIDSGTVNVTGESAAGDSYGICAADSFSMGGGDVTATSGEAAGSSYGIRANGSFTMGGGDVTATSGEAAGGSYGIHTSSSVTINGGSVTAASGNAVGGGRYSCGIRARASITIHNGTVNAAAGNSIGTGSDSYSIGLHSEGAITINGGEVNATSGTALNYGLSYGIYSRDVISIGGGMVTATGGAGNSWSTGIHCTGTDIVITGGTVIAKSDNFSGPFRYGLGIFTSRTLTISGGNVTGIGGTGLISCGLIANESLAITGGTVEGRGGPLAGTDIQCSAGVYGMRTVTISGGTVTATGGDTEVGNSFGICTEDVRGLAVTITGGTVTATGGTAANGNSSGISATNTQSEDVQVTIEGGAVTATGDAAGVGSYGILAETTGTAAGVTISGSPVVRANMTGEEGVDGGTIGGTTIEKENGIVFENGVGAVYGNVELQEDLTIDAGESLLIPQGAVLTIPDGVTLTNSGAITNEGTIDNQGTLTIEQGGTLTGEVTGNPVICVVTVLTDGNGAASASTATAAAGSTVNLTATPNSGYYFERWEVVSGNLTIENNAFTMPAENVTVKAIFDRSSSGGGSAAYAVAVSDAEHGAVRVSPSRASLGTTVTITVTPDEGYELERLAVLDSRGNGITLTDRGDGRYTFTMPSGKVTVEASFAGIAPEPLPFADVDEGDWFADAVRFVYENGMMNGVSGTDFAPHAAASRSMLVTILYRLEGEPAVDGAMDFTDVAGDAWYADAVRWAAGAGIVGGYGDGRFGAEDAVTREQFAAILYRYAVYRGYDVSVGEDTNILSYADFADLSEYAIPAMQWACGAGVVDGTGDGFLTPRGEATRAQAAAMLQRFCGNTAQ